MATKLMQEVTDAGRPKKKNIGFAQAYKTLFPDSDETWEELKKKEGGVSKDLMEQVTVQKQKMIDEINTQIAKWEDDHPELAVRYNEYRADQRDKDQARRANKKRNTNDDDETGAAHSAEIAEWKEKYMASLEENRQQQTAMLGLAKKLESPSGANGAVVDYELKSKVETLQSLLTERDETISELEKRMEKKKSLIKAKNTELHKMETELKKFKKAKPAPSKEDSDDEGSEE